MADNPIRIDIRRSDGEITRLEGHSGLAACMGPIADDPVRSDPPAISLRCSTPAELAWNLAAVMGAVRHLSPAAFEMAHALMPLCKFDRPDMPARFLRPFEREPPEPE